MRVDVERPLLLRALAHVHRVVERRNTIQILSNVLLRAQGSELELKATDLEIEIVERTQAEVLEAGATTVPALTLYDIVRKLPEAARVTLELEPGSNQLVIKSGRSRFTLQTLPEADFPDLAAGDLPHRFTLSPVDLKRLIGKTEFAISTEETRYYLNGIYLHTVESELGPRLRAVATDGHRLARVEMPAPSGSEGLPGIIIPRKAVGEIQRLLDGSESVVELSISPAKIRVTVGTLVLTSKLIDGTFPDYNHVIPQSNTKILYVNKAQFMGAVDRVSTISSDRGRAVKMALDDNRIVFSVTNPDAGMATEEIEADYSSDALEIGFNARYLLDIASEVESETIIFKLADSGSPTIVQEQGDASALYVLMPMRV
jgi:DNA polymerase III subunit beta